VNIDTLPVRSSGPVVTRCLSFHARYACRHTGACCTAGWPIPVEADRYVALRDAIGNRRLHAARDPFVALDDAEMPALMASRGSRCVFHDATSARCTIHAALGHDALPLVCRQFPRVVVSDPRGVSITLSHYCPTAAAALASGDGEVAIMDNAFAFPSGAEYVGLDARDALPPLLRPDMLMDWESWWEWEVLSVRLLGSWKPDVALDRLHTAVEAVRPWSPSDGPLRAAVRRAFDLAAGEVAHVPRDPAAARALIHDAVPDRFRASLAPAGTGAPVADRSASRFLAAHAFANWTAHLGDGLRAWLRSIEAAHALLVTGDDVRQADLKLRHLCDPYDLARRWSEP
jgi:Fe-S-cluster containining protein